MIPEGKVHNNYAFGLREEGTSNCAQANGGHVVMAPCDLPDQSEEWQITHPSTQRGQITATSAGAGLWVTGHGGDTPLVWENSDGPAADQNWVIACVSNPNTCSL